MPSISVKFINLRPYFRSFSFCWDFSPYFDHDAFTHHASHVGLLTARLWKLLQRERERERERVRLQAISVQNFLQLLDRVKAMPTISDSGPCLLDIYQGRFQ